LLSSCTAKRRDWPAADLLGTSRLFNINKRQLA
jgi:hypothetical protein